MNRLIIVAIVAAVCWGQSPAPADAQEWGYRWHRSPSFYQFETDGNGRLKYFHYVPSRYSEWSWGPVPHGPAHGGGRPHYHRPKKAHDGMPHGGMNPHPYYGWPGYRH